MSQNYRTTVTAQENDWMHERMLALMRHEPGSPARAPIVRQMLQRLHDQRTLAGWRRNLARKFRLEGEIDDVGQIIAESVATFLSNVEQRKFEKMQQQYLQQLWNEANLGVKTYQEGGEHTGVSGFTSIARRRKLIARARVELAHQLQREPSNDEVKDHINAQMMATRKNAVKQGVLIKDSDFTAGVMLSGDQAVFEDGDTTVHDTIADDSSRTGFLQIEVDEAMRALVTHMREQHPEDPHIVQCTVEWARCVLGGEEPTPYAVNREVDCGVRIAEQCIAKLMAELPSFSVAFDA
ncbi:hypothetical protein EDF62_3238 [Leucobacter luti]|uniref:Uncharacterized protein n=1 Tax=Leucobacter luti TaxID=340320 RepID=A0A4R6RT67_9MICO|nr:hypothetical protein [Leucobacter luti]TDP89507.1 hypothetical protein EDF62_3238 [Leucobacter luti]